jgi:hypothetical protein
MRFCPTHVRCGQVGRNLAICVKIAGHRNLPYRLRHSFTTDYVAIEAPETMDGTFIVEPIANALFFSISHQEKVDLKTGNSRNNAR